MRGIVEMGLVAVCVRMIVSVRMPVIVGVFVRRFVRFGAMVMTPVFAVVMLVLVPVVMPMRFMTVRMRRLVLMIVAMSRCRFVTFVFVLVFVRHIFPSTCC